MHDPRRSSPSRIPDDVDVRRAVQVAGAEPVAFWHGDTSIGEVDAVVVPGVSPTATTCAVAPSPGSRRSWPTSCTTPTTDFRCSESATGSRSCARRTFFGVLTRNESLHYVCRDQGLTVERTSTAWTNGYAADGKIVIPVKHGEGRYVADDETLAMLEGDGLVVVRYADGNPKVLPRHRRYLQRARQRGGLDAPSGARGRTADRGPRVPTVCGSSSVLQSLVG